MQFVTRMDVRDVYLDEGTIKSLQGIEDGNGSKRVGCGVHDERIGLLACRLDPIDQCAFVIGLMKLKRDTQPLGELSATCFNGGERRRPIDVWLAHAQEVEIGAVENHKARDHRILPCGVVLTKATARRCAPRAEFGAWAAA